ncbi:leucine--tRNA ligase [Abditibacterium utsteinense]|nr:leucine--tRNA ligase [Abditibacterium utsteinense]
MSTENRYNPKEIEPKWQQKWAEKELFKTGFDPKKPKFYYLDMFPYPSGALHVGHVRNYAIGDAVARFRVMNGYNVLHPMGWDAFGLPAENAAIKHNTHPAAWTDKCIEQMHEQFGKLGIAFDWNREIATCKPDYYKWTQWLFIQFFKAGLVERRTANVNWCPKDATVLANEQVKDGKCDRCGTLVEQKPLTQWFFKTTDFAQRLLDDMDTLTDWPENVLKIQREWIGRSEGVNFRFPVKNSDAKIEVFTTRVDTAFGVTYMVLAPDHELVESLVAGTEWETPAREFRDHVARQKDEQRDYGDEIPKEGIFTGAYCINPMSGAEVPIWLANYVVSDYGSGAVMAVPAHDERDFEFAQKYDLPIKVVIDPATEAASSVFLTVAYTEKENGSLVNSGDFDGLNPVEARQKITEFMEANGIGERTVNFKLRDWCLSRQRYWGCPIPVVYCEDGTVEAVPEDQLPVVHPTDIQFTGQGNPLTQSQSFINTTDSKGRPARRETDTLDTFVDSSWYFLRFCSPDASDAPFRAEDIARWMPIDQYVGGIEHARGHLIYARVWMKAMFDLGLVKSTEPFQNYFAQGMVTMFSPTENKLLKMSKSKGNVVTLDAAVEKFGADATRMMTLFMGPPALDVEWTKQSDDTFAGTFRFLERVWRVSTARDFHKKWKDALQNAELSDADQKLRRKTHQTIERITSDIERFSMNTAISGLMEHVNSIQEWLNSGGENSAVYSEAIENLLLCLSPFAPHLSDELGEKLGFPNSFYHATWPTFDAEVAKESEIVVPVQINGKVRTRLSVSAEIPKEELESQALQSPEIAAILEGKTPKKVVVVPGRLVNIVV